MSKRADACESLMDITRGALPGAPISDDCYQPRTTAPSGYGMRRQASVYTCLKDKGRVWFLRRLATINEAHYLAIGVAAYVCGI